MRYSSGMLAQPVIQQLMHTIHELNFEMYCRAYTGDALSQLALPNEDDIRIGRIIFSAAGCPLRNRRISAILRCWVV
jgi:hypothetical protein